MEDGNNGFKIYLPARTAVCIEKVKKPRKAKAVVTEEVDLSTLEGQSLKVDDNTGFLVQGTDEKFELQVVKAYTMADGQPAVKVMRIK